MRYTKLGWAACLVVGTFLFYLLSSPFLFAASGKQTPSSEKGNSPAPASTATPQARDVHLMLYSHTNKDTTLSGLALVKDRRSFSLTPGRNTLTLNNISSFLLPTSILIRPLDTSKDTTIIEQNFYKSDISWKNLQENSIGKEIYFRSPSSSKTNNENGAYLKGRLLNFSTEKDLTSSDVALVERDGIIFRVNSQDLAYAFPSGEKNVPPHITLDINSPDTQNNILVETSYLTPGISWNANYVGEVNEETTLLEITGWVTLTNQTNISYPNAKITLAAYDPLLPSDKTQRKLEAIYPLPSPVSLSEGKTKQVLLFHVSDLPMKLSYKLNVDKEGFTQDVTSRSLKGNVETWAHIPHPKQFSEQLPQGELLLYQRMKEGTLEFLGNNTVIESPEKEGLELRLGLSDGISAVQEQTDFKMLRPQFFESGYLYTLSNTSSHPITVDVIATFPGEWQILRESHPHETTPTDFPLWKIKIPAQSKAELRYRVRVGLPVES